MASRSTLYTSLDARQQEIRLLQVKPYEDDILSTCECTMTVACLSQEPVPKYNAFSYEWGHQPDIPVVENVVIVNGHRKKVSKNLVALLLRYRNIAKVATDWPQMCMPIWIDALCIDQDNIEERNEQVALMGAIYTNAQATYTWLGEGEDDSDYAMEMVREVGQMLLSSRQSDDYNSWIEPEQQKELWQISQSDDYVHFNRFWTSLAALMQRSYWKRAWIVQEVTLPPQVLVFCGQGIAHYLDLLAINRWLNRIQDTPCPESVDGAIWYFISSQASRGELGMRNLHTLGINKAQSEAKVASEKEIHLAWKTAVLKNIRQQATDPRDHLYSVLGLLGPGAPRPDYSASAEQLYQDFAETFIRLESSISILTYSGHCEIPQDVGETGKQPPAVRLFVPSWVPNWDQISKVYSFSWLLHHSHRADNGWQDLESLSSIPPWAITGHTLSVQGVFFDTVHSSHRCSTKDGTWLAFCRDYLQRHHDQPYPYDMTVLEVLGRLVMRDQRLVSKDSIGSDPGPLALIDIYTGFLAAAATNVQDPLWIKAKEEFGINTTEQDIYAKFKRVPNMDNLEAIISEMEEHQNSPTRIQGPDSGVYTAHYARKFVENIAVCMPEYELIVTTKGFVGWSRKGVQKGDRICVLPSCPMPVVLRKVHSHHIHLGQCYVQGLMYGEAVSSLKNGTAATETFHIT